MAFELALELKQYMEIKINRYIIHLLEKEAKKTEATLDFSKEVMKSDEFSITLMTEVHKAITESSSLKNTHFKENETNNFTNGLIDYLSTDKEDEFFIFTKSLEDLKAKIENESFATGGYYLFVDYLVDSKRFIGVILLRKKSGINITKVGNTYKLNTSENINIDKIAMAARLNLEIYNETEDKRNYLALITTQQNGVVSKYFREWVLAAGYIKNALNTANLVKLIKSIDLPIDENGHPRYKNHNDFQKDVYEYAKSRANRIVNLRDMGRHFYGDDKELTFLNFASENDVILDPEFVRDAAKWKTLVTIRAKVEGVELNVDYNKINKDDVIIEENRIVINSRILVNQINKQYQLLDRDNG